MSLLITAVVVTGIYFTAQTFYAWGAWAFVIAAASLWWDGQTGCLLDQDL
ncbi:MAG: hypothetical protein ACT4QE_20380 [Anaerolineales bacterium]